MSALQCQSAGHSGADKSKSGTGSLRGEGDESSRSTWLAADLEKSFSALDF